MVNANFSAPIPKNEEVKTYAPGTPEKKQLKNELRIQSDTLTEIPLVINGEKIYSNDTYDIKMPHLKNKVIANAPYATKKHVESAISSCIETQKDWNNLPWEERASIFLKAADLLSTKYRSKMNAATMLGQSKSCYQAEIDAACELADFFRFNVSFAQSIYEEQPLHSPFGQWNRTSNRGLEGFVFAACPFNFSSIAVNLAAAPALMGCSVLWKPAPTATASAWIGMQILEEAGLPPGVINFITGDPELIGATALTHSNLAAVHFTGSTKVFENIWQKCANNISSYKNYPRLVGETGGKDFIFAHPSAHPQQLITALIRGAFEYQGQKCSAASRAYIPKSIWNVIKDELVETSSQLKIGPPEDFTNFLNAVIDEKAYEKITSYIKHAQLSNEADILAGGEYSDKDGFFIKPTLIEAKTPTYKSMVEEIFGPVLTLFIYEDQKLEETINICQETSPYALTGAIFAQDRISIQKLTNLMQYNAGNFYINDKPTGAVVGQQPFGGSRKSGTNDKAGSKSNLMRWVSQRTIKENFLDIQNYKYPHMMES